MVQKYQSPVRVYKYPFELIMLAYERRFPTCPQIPVFVGCEVMRDEESPNGQIRTTERRCKLIVDAPYLLKKIIGVDYVYFIQKNLLDRRRRCLSIEAYNESFSSRVEVMETCRYFAHPENPDWTCFEQTASLDIKSFFGFENTMEKLGMKQYSQNIAKGKEIIDFFLTQLKEEGIEHAPRWEGLEDQESDASADRQDDMNGGSGGENRFQLDSDYIHRYLGELSVMEESQLIHLRKWVADLQKGKVPTDATLLRFLRARDFNVEKAREMLSRSLTWRKKHAVDRILSEYQTVPVVKEYFPGGWHHHDREGAPLYVLRLGQMDVKGLLKSIGEEGLLKLALHVCEEGLQRVEEATRSSGRAISTWSLLVDLEGLNMRHLWRPGIRALLRIIEIVEANYPETLKRVLIIRAPRVFPILWTLVSTFIDENTRSKFLFYGGNDYLDAGGLADYIPTEYMPDFLGGSSKTAVGEGGLVPKSLYVTDVELEKEGCPLTEDSIYRSVTLSRSQIHDVVIHNDEPGSVITWDFDIMRQDVMFSVLYTKHPVNVSSPTGTLQSFAEHMNPLGTHHEHRSVIDKSWTEGQEYSRLEQLICHDGESIQGTHVAVNVGTYILQWKFHCHHQMDLIDSITGPKAQVMYFHEKLKATDYRGSMSSLQSATSAMSTMSAKSGASSCPSR